MEIRRKTWIFTVKDLDKKGIEFNVGQGSVMIVTRVSKHLDLYGVKCNKSEKN